MPQILCSSQNCSLNPRQVGFGTANQSKRIDLVLLARCLMRTLKCLSILLLVFSTVAASGKDKKKFLLPADILRARTVLVVVDPMAGVAIDSPLANSTARDAVERALMNWGRFELATDVSTADLVITVRRGNGKMAQPTIGGLPQNNRPVIFQPSESGGRVGSTRGTPPMTDDTTAPRYPDPHPQAEVGPTEDMFAVYRGKRDDALESAPVWRFNAKNALSTPRVRAVEEFRKLLIEAEKQENDSQ